MIDSSIAVEVRRLNQFIAIDGTIEPIEDLEYQLMPRFMGLLKKYDRHPSDLTSFVSVNYKRPLIINKQLIHEIKNILPLQLSFLDQKLYYDVSDKLRLRFFPSAKNYKKPYVFGSLSDGDGGGFVVSYMLDSLKIIIEEKEREILPFKDRYPTWWLAVNDKIGYGIDDIDLNQLSASYITRFFQDL